MSNYQMPSSISSLRWIARLLSQSHLVTDSYPWETLLTLKLGWSTTVTTSDCAVKFLVLPFTVKIANRRNRDINGKI